MNNPSEATHVNRICTKSIKGAYKGKLRIFMKWNLKINIELKPLQLIMGSNNILRKIDVEVD